MREFITSKAGFTIIDQKLDLREIINSKPRWISIARDSEVLFPRTSCAARFTSRLRGLMFYPTYPNFDGLLLIPCHEIHMFWMKFPLDLVYLSSEGRILTTVANLAPGKLGPKIKETMAVLELPVGTVARYGLKNDESLEIKNISEKVE